MSPLHISNPEAQFIDAASQRGLIIENLCGDGQIYRVPVRDARRGNRDGAYILYLDGLPAGGFRNWRDGLGWQKWRASVQITKTPEERAAFRAGIERQKREREKERDRIHEQARRRALSILRRSSPADPQHPYLARKQVCPYGLYCYRGLLVVPMRSLDGKVRSVQFIAPDSRKRFLKGGRKEECFFGIGRPSPSGSIAIAEGFATGVSIFEAAGLPVAVAFDAGNLLPVAGALRSKYPDAGFILAADDDWRRINPQTGRPENIGVIKACEAAAAIGGWLAVPAWQGHREEHWTDFNDLSVSEGPDAVLRCIRGAKHPGAPL